MYTHMWVPIRTRHWIADTFYNEKIFVMKKHFADLSIALKSLIDSTNTTTVYLNFIALISKDCVKSRRNVWFEFIFMFNEFEAFLRR